ncbi:MAG: M14 family zinc carboxypeptidase [Nitriliruptor sp.]|uniref:M14 family zinc carboxypeptidase n=1 Tax=Nitriliruptor sp. TaxID=2448056 RepID=UPI0034A06D5D
MRTRHRSPNANGNVCAAQFVQWDEAIAGLAFLEDKYPRYVQLINLRTQFGDHDHFATESLRSAGIPREDLSREHRDLYVVKVTDADSPTPEADRKHFAYSLSIHGIERAGLEGGLRAAEDLATWAACENGDAPTQIDCTSEGSSPDAPRRLLDPFDDEGRSPTAGEALADGVLLFTLSNPDGWVRGDYSEGGVFYQRFNGNGMDLNRDWPTQGYSDPAYTSFSEPETRGFGKWLKWVADNRTGGQQFAGGIDLHGMVTANSLSYTLLGAAQKDFRKNAITVDTAELMFRDAEERLTWSPHVARAEDCPGPVPEPFFGQGRTTAPMCTVQWGTVWDTIEYQITGGMGDWMDNPELGLGGVGINNEMALSHLAPNNVFLPDVVQLQVEGNKSLIYSQVTSLLHEDEIDYEPGGRIAFLDDPDRVQSDGEEFVTPPGLDDLPTQGDIEGRELTGAEGFEFVVRGPQHGIFNGGMTIEATAANVRGVGAGIVTGDMILDYCGAPEGEEQALTHQHSHELGMRTAADEHDDEPAPAEGCEEVARAFDGGPLYAQSGAQIEFNRPQAGVYRVRPNPQRVGPIGYTVRFTRDDAIPGWDDQAAYDVSRIDFFRDLNDFMAASGSELVGLSVDQIAADPDLLRTFDTFVVADRFVTGGSPHGGEYADAVESFVRTGGNLVLTDGAVAGLAALDIGIPADAIRRGVYYAGYIDFNDGTGPTFGEHELTQEIARDGTASGRQTLDGTRYYDRRQTFEPVPTGHLVGGPSTCSSGCDAPINVVDPGAWDAAGGTNLGRSYVRPGPQGGAGFAGVSLGELPVEAGTIRIIGALLPEPTTENFHPYGLSSHALTYTGYQLFENATAWENAGRIERDDVDGGDDGGDGGDDGALSCVSCELEVRAGDAGTAELDLTAGDAGSYELEVTDVPARWNAEVTPQQADLDVGEQAPVTVRVQTPNNARDTHTLTVVARQGGEVIATADVVVEVIRGRPAGAGNGQGVEDRSMTTAGAMGSPPTPALWALLGALALAVASAARLRSHRRTAATG